MQTANGGVGLVSAVATPVAQASHQTRTNASSDAPRPLGPSNLLSEATGGSRAYPIAQCRPATSSSSPPPIPGQQPSVDPARLNEYIDRVASFLKQKRQERAAAGEIVVEDSSSIGIDLDRVDAFFYILGGRQGRIVGSFASRRMMSRFTSYIMMVMTLLPMLIIVAPVLVYSDSIPFPWSFAMFMCIVQPLGIGGLYWTNRLRDGMLPRRHKDGKTIRILLTGAWFFGDRVITADQSRALLAVEVGQYYSTMLYLLSSMMALLTTNISTDNGVVFFLFMILFALPGVVWYQLIKRMHQRYLQNGPNRATYNPLSVRSDANEPECLRDLEGMLDESIARPSAPPSDTDEPAARVEAEPSVRSGNLDLV